jgi:tRNA wybutosine-synthesizing protein 1
MLRNGWEKLNESLALLNSMSCRSLVRLTAIKHLNINEKYIENYIKIIEKANPNFFEIKGFTLQAKALKIKERLKSDKQPHYFFPEYEFLENFSLKFEEMSGFPIIYKSIASRDFLFAVNWDRDKDPKITKG